MTSSIAHASSYFLGNPNVEKHKILLKSMSAKR